MPILAEILSRPAFRSIRPGLPFDRWLRVARERRRLAELDEHALRDIGIDPASAAREAARPFWDLPRSR